MSILDSHVQGIPCQVRVTDYVRVKPNRLTWDSADDYYGYTEMEWELLDRKGYPAKWLENKLTDDDIERIENEIAAHYETEAV